MSGKISQITRCNKESDSESCWVQLMLLARNFHSQNLPFFLQSENTTYVKACDSCVVWPFALQVREVPRTQ